ncbi:50S ribosomal protein L24e [Acidilobus saccharovorans 345-15]|uniref:Large ribosomal subunit protein eL24 n=1 Tax=Acidilobus saccharovorans (strain DSM 16705 / JCM 18335 / VKM B-2471 / 345-15) TaxID=666510 RepID=D9Q2K9_ACIS3|nr:50S ribosomal protein L24e [Acidilobus saccharovorans 345-15]
MPKEMTCAFCGRPIEPGTGKMYVSERGEILWYCSSKCFKSAIKLKRNPRKLKWARPWVLKSLA